MKLFPLPKPLEEKAGNDVVIIITHVGTSQRGLPCARVSVWNGKPLAVDVIEPDAATDRRRLAKLAALADPVAVPDVAAIELAIVQCAEALQACDLRPPAQDARGEAEAEARPSADFPGLIDVVADENGEPAFLVLDPGSKSSVSVVAEYVPAEGAALVPPPAKALPWLLPRAVEVLRYLAPGADTGASLFSDVASCVKQHALLPVLPKPHEEAYYELCAAWEFHTYYMEPAAYSPELAFCAQPERGKSRTGRTLIYIARHGVHTETLREANLFRDSQDRRATLFLDCKSLWAKAEKLGCEDILLQRFERGARVSRVLYPERGPFEDTVYYDIFGPTVLASNEPLGRILDTRCIPIGMPLAPDDVEYPVPDEVALQPLRERLTAWRARQLIAGWQPETVRKPATSRLGDVLLPLMQIVAHVAPERLDSLRVLAKHLERGRRQERALSWEASIVVAVNTLSDRVANALLLVDVIAEAVNAGRSEKERLSNKRIGNILRSLGLEIKKGHANKAALVWNDEKIAALTAHYWEPEPEAGLASPDEKPVQIPASMGAAVAHHANQTKPAGVTGEHIEHNSAADACDEDGDTREEGFDL